MLHLSKLTIVFIFVSLTFSCITHKSVLYLQDIHSTDSTSIKQASKDFSYKLKSGDVLYVKISSMDQGTDIAFNNNSGSAMTTVTNLSLFVTGYTINDSGYIKLPIVGPILLKNLPIEQARKTIENQVALYYNNASVVVKMVSFKVTILGEVYRPGTIDVYKDNLNLLEALGLAGDLTPYGNRTNIKLIRKINNESKVYLLNLQDKNILTSPFYNIYPDDIIYVEPFAAKQSGFQSAPIQISLSALTTFVLILSYIHNLK